MYSSHKDISRAKKGESAGSRDSIGYVGSNAWKSNKTKPIPAISAAGLIMLLKLLKLYGVAYPVAVGVLALLKLKTDLLGSASWAEVFYGPAIGFGSCYFLICVGCWIEWRIRGKAKRH